MEQQIINGIGTYIRKIGNWNNVEILYLLSKNNFYFVEYRAKYFDGGGYRWTNKKEKSIPKIDLMPYIIDKKIIDIISYDLKTRSNVEDVEICSIILNENEYLVEYQQKYFDGGGYRWTDVIVASLQRTRFESYLRKEKIIKIKERV